MKKAREIVIPEDRPLSYKEFSDIREHAIRSSAWYGSEYRRSKHQIVEKLIRKGYTREPVLFVDHTGEEHSHDIIEEVLDILTSSLVVNDEDYARGLVERYRLSNRGDNFIRMKLKEAGIDSELAETAIEANKDEDELLERIDNEAERFKRRSTYFKEDNIFKKEQKLTRHLASRGFSFDDIASWRSVGEE